MTDYFADLPDELITGKRPTPVHVLPCDRCHGSKVFRSWAGRIVGPCHACKGTGQITRTTSQVERDRAKAGRARAKATKAIALRDRAEAWKIANEAEWAWIKAKAPTFDFADAMAEALHEHGALSEGQMAAVRRLAAADVEREARFAADRIERIAAAKAIDVAVIEQAFAAANSRAVRHPKLRLDTFLFSQAPASGMNPGAIYVKEGETYLGKIVGSKLLRSFKCDPPTEARILAAASDPRAAAIAYGQRTGTCSVCHRLLTDPESVDAGIGPVCASKYGWA